MKRCSACDSEHWPPLGRRCKNIRNMAYEPGSGSTDRTSKEYLISARKNAWTARINRNRLGIDIFYVVGAGWVEKVEG